MSADREFFKNKAARVYARRPVFSIAASLGALSAKWLKRGFVFRKEAVRRLVLQSRFSPRMAEALLDSLFRELTGPKLTQLLKTEFKNPRVLDWFQFDAAARRRVCARGPGLITHVFSGNVPNPSVVSLILGMLVKSTNSGKASARDGGITDIYLRSLKAHDAELASVNRLLDPSDRAALRHSIEASGLVVAYGGDEALAAIRRMTPASADFCGYGHRMSFSLFTREALSPKNLKTLAQKTAQDVWMADQRGCLSPLVVYLQSGGAVAPVDFAEALAGALERSATRDGADFQPTAERIAAAEILKNDQRVRKSRGENARVYESKSRGRWLVVYDEDPKEASFSKGNQVIVVKAYRRLESVLSALAPWASRLQATALETGARPRADIARQLAELGVNRICRAGRMQFPPLVWHHDGRMNLAGWVRWVDWEDAVVK